MQDTVFCIYLKFSYVEFENEGFTERMFCIFDGH